MIPKDTPIAVVAPCGAYDPERLEAGMEILRARGHAPQLLPGAEARWRYLAGDDDHRTAQLTEALTNDAYGAVWMARGGSGLGRILHRLPLAGIAPKPVVGFSDITSLMTALDRVGGWPMIHGPVVHSLSVTDDGSLDHLFDLLAGRPVQPLQGVTGVVGQSTGGLVGGNVAVLASGCGTPWQLDARGRILVLEEIGEPAYRLDRLVQQLRSAGVFDGVVGVALGQLHNCRVPEGADYTIVDVVMGHLAKLGVPVIFDLPVGHTPQNRAFPWGAQGTLSNGTLSW